MTTSLDPESGRRQWAVLAVVSAAQFLIILDLWVVNIALPALQRDFAPATLTDPATGLPGDGIEAQTELALRNLEAVLTAAGASLSALVKTTIFYANVEDFATINEVYARFMPDPPPARSAPANVALPRGLLISIEAVAVLPGHPA
jgi:2-iminobutanoate/2-iminopropanoate deaminase